VSRNAIAVAESTVRGAPELAHVSVVRAAKGEPPIAYSRFGLYVPRDEPQAITLAELSPHNVSYMTAYPLHPQHTRGDIEFPAQQPYTIPVRDAMEETISGGRKEKNPRPSINGYMYGNANALSSMLKQILLKQALRAGSQPCVH
jgi:hypothetical protein